MGDIGTPMTSGTVPTVGTSGTGYATTINSFLTEVKQRLEAKVPFSSLLVGALDMANSAVQNVSNLLLYPGTGAPTTPVGSLQRFSNELYWVGASGAVQITNGTALNSAGLGGITGDYGGVNPAQFRFDDANQVYYAYDDFSGLAWAYVRTRGIEIAGGATSLVRARIDWAGSSSYTLTLPAALPASQVLLQVTAAGQLTASNTLPTNTNITLQGTGKLVHGTQTVSAGLDIITVTAGSLSLGVASDQPIWSGTASLVAYVKIPLLDATKRLQSVSLHSNGAGVGADPTLVLIVNSGSQPCGFSTPTVGASGASAFGQRKTTITVSSPVDYVEPIYWLKITSSLAMDYYKVTATYTSA